MHVHVGFMHAITSALPTLLIIAILKLIAMRFEGSNFWDTVASIF